MTTIEYIILCLIAFLFAFIVQYNHHRIEDLEQRLDNITQETK